MFKRVEKRIRKKQKEEELGLDGEMKEMLGMNDTDSDESSSGSESGSEVEEEEPRLRPDDDASDEEEDDEEDEGEGEEDEESEPGSADEEDEEPPMSISEALKNPVYLVSLEPEIKACIVCPGKLLKNPVMIDVHIKSGVSLYNIHSRCLIQG